MTTVFAADNASFEFYDFLAASNLLIEDTTITRAFSTQFEAFAIAGGDRVSFRTFGENLRYARDASGQLVLSGGVVTGYDVFLNDVFQGQVDNTRILVDDVIAVRQADRSGVDVFAVERFVETDTFTYRGGNGPDRLQPNEAIGRDNYPLQLNGNDDFDLGEGPADFWAGGGDDIVTSGASNDRLRGGAGDDVLSGGAGADILDGGTGSDLAAYTTARGGVTADLLAPRFNTGDAAGDTYISIEDLGGSNFNDVLRGSNEGNVIFGEAGDDVVFGRGGGDGIFGGAGNDALFGDAGDDELRGEAGNDALFGGTGADILNGGTGVDSAVYSRASSGVVADLIVQGANRGEAAGDTFIDIEQLVGSRFADRLAGDEGANRLTGGGGNDVVIGRGGNDLLIGNDGNDSLVGGTGNDALVGGNGNDALVGGAGADIHNGGAGFDVVSYGSARTGVVADMLAPGAGTGDAAGDSFVSIEGLFGSRFDDSLRGTNADDFIRGENGNDVLFGRDGDDRLIGGAGSDTLFGGTGSDLLRGGRGEGDVFTYTATSQSVLRGEDVIADFERGRDVIDLSVIDADPFAAGNQRFTFVDRFTGAGGEVRAVNGVVVADVDGDFAIDFAVRTPGVQLTETDFIL